MTLDKGFSFCSKHENGKDWQASTLGRVRRELAPPLVSIEISNVVFNSVMCFIVVVVLLGIDINLYKQRHSTQIDICKEAKEGVNC